MATKQLTDSLVTTLKLNAPKHRKPKRCEHAYLEATKDFIAFHADVMRRHFASDENFLKLSPEHQDIYWRLHWIVGLKAITRFKRFGEMPSEKWVKGLIGRLNPDFSDETAKYFLGFARAMIEAYLLWFEDFQTDTDTPSWHGWSYLLHAKSA